MLNIWREPDRPSPLAWEDMLGVSGVMYSRCKISVSRARSVSRQSKSRE